MEVGGGKVSELTPAALYEIFVELCRSKLHIIISYDAKDEKIIKMLRKHKAILNSAVHCRLKVGPFDFIQTLPKIRLYMHVWMEFYDFKVFPPVLR